MSKSFVTLEQQVCIVCGNPFDTGSLLIDRRMSNRFEQRTITGRGMCPEHQALHDEGYVALVGIDPDKSDTHGGTVLEKGAYRTGNIMHVRRSAWSNIFDAPLPPGPMAYVDDATIRHLQARIAA